MTKYTFFLLVSILLLALAQSCRPTDVQQRLAVSNQTGLRLADKAVSIERSQLRGLPTGEMFPVLISRTGDSIAVQTDDLDGDSVWDQLFFVLDLNPWQSDTLELSWTATAPAYPRRSNVRFGKRGSVEEKVQPASSEIVYPNDMPARMGFQRYQTDGPSWENDKVGFRHYLDGRNARDVFGKTTKEMSPETVGISESGAVEDNYHVMHPWGRDIMAVGNSIGIGGLALLQGDSVIRLGIKAGDTTNNIGKTEFKIVSKGPVRSIMNFRYNDWLTPGGKYQLQETTSIWPGMFAYHSSVKMTGEKEGDLLLVGMVNIFAEAEPELVRINDEWVALISHAKHTYNQEWWLGLALLLPAADYMGYLVAPDSGQLTQSLLVKLTPGNNPIDYYSIAGWELSDPGFRDPVYFREYVLGLARQLSAPVEVHVL